MIYKCSRFLTGLALMRDFTQGLMKNKEINITTKWTKPAV
jgi:hypothetical protein